MKLDNISKYTGPAESLKVEDIYEKNNNKKNNKEQSFY